MTGDGPSIRGLSLTRSYGEGTLKSYALKDVTIDLHFGQLALLMGPSGSGKTTLLTILSGLLQPDAGQVLAADDHGLVDIWKLTDGQRENFRLRNCGFIFQGYNLFPALTARQQLEIVLRWGNGTPGKEARRRADEMLSQLGLSEKANRKPAQLSGGEKQRVAIGRALIKNPRFCFADEPTSALDWTSGEKVIRLLQDAAHERNSTILVVSHDHRIMPFVDTHYHLEDGQLSESTVATGGGPGFESWRTMS